jgi:multidrug efflux pump subunit AcrA (membrane-fusion protein)
MIPSQNTAAIRPVGLPVAALAPCLLLASLWLAACGQDGQQQFPPPDVSVATVVQRSVTEWDDYSGHIEAIEAAEIRPRVTGHLNKVHYREGGLVEKGQLLFTIDDREYAASSRGPMPA